jgi:LPXTG-motif cell wall-anchored protein
MAAVLSIALLFSASPVSADGYGGGTLTIDDATLVPGQQFHLPGTGCAGGATVVVSFDGRQIGTTTADGDGRFELVGTVPGATEPGQFTVTATCGDLVQSLVVTVAEPAKATGAQASAAPTPGDMPRTGTEIGPLLRMAAALVLVGTGLVFLARRRRATVRPA